MFDLEYITNFRDVKKHWGTTLRGGVREMVLDGLAMKNELSNYEKWYLKPRIQFLFIHHIFEDEEKNFDLVLKELTEHHTFISHSEAVERLLTGKVDKPYISWSSDDGFKNNLVAARILNKYGAKAIFYINPETIGVKDVNKAGEFCLKKLDMPPVEFLNWDEVQELLNQGHEIGSHTMAHDNITKMTLNEVEDDLSRSKEILSKRCGPVGHFAYPYGRYSDFNKQALELVFKTGYESCSTGERGCHVSDGSSIEKEQLVIRRDQIIAYWKLGHMKYFIANGAKKAVLENNFIPEEWK